MTTNTTVVASRALSGGLEDLLRGESNAWDSIGSAETR